MTYPFLYAAPRQTMTTGSVKIDTVSTLTGSLFRITGGPIVVWNLYGIVTTAFPGGSVQWSLGFVPTLSPTLVALTINTNTFGYQALPGSKWFMEDVVAASLMASNVVVPRGNAHFSRFLTPGDILHLNENNNGGTPGEMQYYILWSPLTNTSNVQGL